MSAPEPNRTNNPRIHLIWGSVFVAAMLAGFYTYKLTLDRGSQAIRAAVEKGEQYAAEAAAFAERSAEKFKTGTITETFHAEFPVFHSAGFGRLEVGVSEATETFKKSDVRKAVWDWVYLGETIAEIKVPVTYRYHLDLGEDWALAVADKTCIVRAPALKPSLPVAIHTDRMEKQSASGWARFDGSDQLEALQRTITPTLNQNASTPEHINNIREAARDVVARFVRAWLMREEQWNDDKLTSIIVIFADESPDTAPLQRRLTFQPQ